MRGTVVENGFNSILVRENSRVCEHDHQDEREPFEQFDLRAFANRFCSAHAHNPHMRAGPQKRKRRAGSDHQVPPEGQASAEVHLTASIDLLHVRVRKYCNREVVDHQDPPLSMNIRRIC